MPLEALELATMDDEPSAADDEQIEEYLTRSSSPDTTSSEERNGVGAGITGGPLVKRPWTPEEDAALVAAVHKYGACRWSMIATQLSTGRVGKQCRERWNNHLCPEVKKTEWSEEEDRAILQGVAVLGTRWCEIIKSPPLSGRTDNAIKNRFYSLQRRMKARQAGSYRSNRHASAASDDEVTIPGQTDRIMAIATELAFSTDESERDRLIELLTATLHEDTALSTLDDDNSSDIGTIESPHELAQLEGLSSALGFSGPTEGERSKSMRLQPHKLLSPFAIPEHASAVADLLQLPPSPRELSMRDLGASKPARPASPIVEGDVGQLVVDTSSTASTISPDGAGSTAALAIDAWQLPSDLGADAIADQLPALVEEGALLSPSSELSSSPAEKRKPRDLRPIEANAPDDARVEQTDVPADCLPNCHSKPKLSIALEETNQDTGVSSNGNHDTAAQTVATALCSPSTRVDARTTRSSDVGHVSATCLGGRHAYKAFLAPLKLPVEPNADMDSPKRLRTATGRTAGTPTSFSLAAPASSGSASRKRGAPLSWKATSECKATGTEEPSTVPTLGATPISPMSELLSFSMFNDLFSETSAALEGGGTKRPSDTVAQCPVQTSPKRSPLKSGHTVPPGEPAYTTSAQTSPSGVAGAIRRSARQHCSDAANRTNYAAVAAGLA